jgi:acetylornithine deacetylase
VPVAGEQWSSDPFKLTQRDGKLYGRGSSDMKAFIACFLTMAPQFKRAKLRSPIHLALSYNEETSMSGMKRLAEHLAAQPVKPAACIIGEPTLMRLVVANKGASIWRVVVRGHSVHSAFRDRGVSAVEMAAELIVFINSLQPKLNAAERHDGFEFPHTSVHVGRIHGGTAHNITARECEFLFEVRALPGVRAIDVVEQIRAHAAQVIEPAMKRISEECGIEIIEIVDAPALDERGNQYLARAIAPICADSTYGRVSFGTEAGILQDIGVQTVVCGPGDIRVAHRPDEFVEPGQLVQCCQMLQRLMGRLSDTTPLWSTRA